MSTSNPTTSEKSQPAHTSGQTHGHRKGLDDQRASQSKTLEEVGSDSAGGPMPTFDEGERKPSIAVADRGGLRGPAPVVRADPKLYKKVVDEDKHTKATMPPSDGQDPKRNTL